MKTVLYLTLLFLMAPLVLLAQQNYIIGETSVQELRERERIFDVYTTRYQPDSSAISFLTHIEDSVQIVAFFGSWCHDSKREVPALLKTLEKANNPYITITLIGVDRQKNDPKGQSQKLHLQYTPTFIIYRRSKEIGRIVEKPAESIEVDLKKILLSGTP